MRLQRRARLRRLEAHLQSLIDFFAFHRELALAAVFIAALAESLALVGTVLPGSTVVFAGGMLIGLKAIDPWAVGVAAVTGAILGDGISYRLGRRYKDAICATWPIRNHPELMARGQAYFAAHGGKSVFLGRFFGPLRAIVPIIAGMSGMPAGERAHTAELQIPIEHATPCRGIARLALSSPVQSGYGSPAPTH